MSIKTAILLLVLAVPVTAAAQNRDCISTRVGNFITTTCTNAPSVNRVPLPSAPPLMAPLVRPQQYQDPIAVQLRLQQLRMQQQALQAQEEARRLEQQQQEEARKREAAAAAQKEEKQ